MILMKIYLIFFLIIASNARVVHIQRYLRSSVNIVVNSVNNELSYSVLKGGENVQKTILDSAFTAAATVTKVSDLGFQLHSTNGLTIEFKLIEEEQNFALLRVSRNLTSTTKSSYTDCIHLDTDRVSWYGGPQQKYQYWPIEKLTFTNYSYVSKEPDSCAITERYWLNSKGVFIFVEDDAPLFLNQNVNGNNLCFLVKNQLPYTTYTSAYTLNYNIGIGRNARQVHLEAVRKFLQKPIGYPDERMVRYPIWSTWARYKADITDSIVLEFADEILEYKFPNSQFEIDDDWEVCYGALTFRTSKFPNITQTTNALKAKGFRVTLWIHPFINKGCEPWYSEAKSKGYLVTDHKNNTDTQWWNSKTGEAAYIDFTKTAAANWFTTRLKTLQQQTGIDSFKFDAGETSWTPPDPILNGSLNYHPNLITSEYVKTVAQFGPLVEVRSGQGTQNLPIFLRIIDKDSEWYWNNGLPTLVTTLLQLNMVGYSFILPDMIGGNGYNNHPPNKEMFIRWLQASVFMPSLQFSYVPWDYDDETISLSLQLTQLHAQYTDLIMERFKLVVSEGQPVNPPMWWIDPNDRVAQQIDDQFLLGETVIVAPILNEGQTSRNIYLPKGNWRDKNTAILHKGPKWVMDYPAPLNILPYFVKE